MKRGVLEKFKLLFSHPFEFFDNVKEENSIVGGFEMFFLAAVFALLVQVVLLLALPLLTSWLNIADVGYFFLTNAGSIIVSIVGLFISALVIHLFVMVFGGKGSFSGTFNVVAYSMAPYVLLSILPVVGLFAMFFTAFLLVVGLMKVHSMNGFKAVFSVLIPLVIFMIAFIMFVLWVISIASPI